MTNENEVAARKAVTDNATTTTQSTPAAPAKTETAKPVEVTSEMSTDDLHKFERDAQLLPADEVKIPGTDLTLADVHARREDAQRAEGVEASKERLRAMQEQSSATLPAKHTVTITETGDVITAPVTDKPTKPVAST